jgi:DNA mismatch repair protein MutH
VGEGIKIYMEVIKIVYDNNDSSSIERYARTLLNRSLYDVLGSDLNHRFENSSAKGRLGQIIEEAFFGYKINSNKEADFKEAGIELKVSPLKQIKTNPKSELLREQMGFSAKERLVLSIINYLEIYKETWENNSMLEKCKNLLLMFYVHESEKTVEDLIFKIINSWTPSTEDLVIIKKDWELIVGKVKAGKAHEISEGDTMYLGACTKGSTAEKSKRKQPFSEELAPQRAFSLKRSYVDFIIEELLQRERYIKSKNEKSISSKFKGQAFDEVILNLFKAIEGLTLEDIIKKFQIYRRRQAKNFIRLIIDDICRQTFEEKLDNLNEFKKANIEIKTVVIKPNGMPKESMSFEQIDFCEICKEEWEDSLIRDKFENKKHLWIIFKATRNFDKQKDLDLNELVLHKVMFWNMQSTDIEGSLKTVWQDTVNKINKGIYSDFIKISDGEIAHIRPKAKDGDDLMITPQGIYEKKKCFWLNASYIKEQIEKEG